MSFCAAVCFKTTLLNLPSPSDSVFISGSSVNVECTIMRIEAESETDDGREQTMDVDIDIDAVLADDPLGRTLFLPLENGTFVLARENVSFHSSLSRYYVLYQNYSCIFLNLKGIVALETIFHQIGSIFINRALWT